MFKLENIINSEGETFGYEILTRSSKDISWDNLEVFELNINVMNQFNYVFMDTCEQRVVFFINVERKQFFNDDFLSFLSRNKGNFSDDKIKVVFEITERGEVLDSDWIHLKNMKDKYGFCLAADDVTCHRDARYQEINNGIYDFVKIELFNPEDNRINYLCSDTNRWMGNLSQEFGTQFIAEKIESEIILSYAKNYPFSYYQGYFFL